MKKRDDIFFSEISDRINRVARHTKNLSEDKFLKSELHRSAVVRELEVIGEAARAISEDSKKNFSDIPWSQIIGLRNRLAHQYFDVDYRIVWEVAKIELPNLAPKIEKAILETAPLVHPWRLCPLGYYHVAKFRRKTSTGRVASVKEHCRRNPSGKDQLYPDEIRLITANQLEDFKKLSRIGTLKEFKYGDDFDDLILGWTKYWNDIFQPSELLDAKIVKALMGSESSFRLSIKNKKVSDGNFARGLMQITDKTRKFLADEQGEIKDHYLTLSKDAVKIPEVAIAGAIRWLFRKRETAKSFLKREPTWVEVVGEYKAYLRQKGKLEEKKGMEVFLGLLERLKGQNP